APTESYRLASGEAEKCTPPGVLARLPCLAVKAVPLGGACANPHPDPGQNQQRDHPTWADRRAWALRLVETSKAEVIYRHPRNNSAGIRRPLSHVKPFWRQAAPLQRQRPVAEVLEWSAAEPHARRS